jgi:hypothetical protein
MEKVIHVHLHRVRPPSAPKRARTHDCTCQKDRRAKDGSFAPAGMEWCSRCNGTGEVGGKECPRCQGSGLVEETGDSKWPRDKAAQDALDQENARELSGLEKHEWNKLSPAKRAEWIQKFAKHKGRTDAKPKDAKRGKDAAFKSPQEALQNVEAAIRGVRSNLRGAPPVYLSDFMQYANQAKSLYKKGDMSGGEAAMVNASKAYQAGIKESRNGDRKPKDEATHPAMQTSGEVQKIVNEIKAYKPQIEAARGSERAKQLRRQQAALVSHLQEHFRTSLARSEWVAN